MPGKGVVTTVMCRHCHDGACTVSGKYIVAYPNRYLFTRKRIDGICAGEYTADMLVHESLAFGAALGSGYVGCHGFALFGGGDFVHIFAFGSKHHKSNTKNRIGTSGEYFEVYIISSFDGKMHFCSFATTYPVALCFLERVGPIDGVKSLKQAFGICTHTQTPLVHHFLLYRVTAAERYAFGYFVIGQYRSQFGTPIDHGVAEICYTIVHQHVRLLLAIHRLPFVGGESKYLRRGCRSVGIGTFLFETCHKFGDGHGLASLSVIVAQEHALKSPLSPFVILGVTCTYFARPVVAKSYLVQLFAIACYIGLSSHLRMLSGLYCILLGRQSVCIISHGM